MLQLWPCLPQYNERKYTVGTVKIPWSQQPILFVVQTLYENWGSIILTSRITSK